MAKKRSSGKKKKRMIVVFLFVLCPILVLGSLGIFYYAKQQESILRQEGLNTQGAGADPAIAERTAQTEEDKNGGADTETAQGADDSRALAQSMPEIVTDAEAEEGLSEMETVTESEAAVESESSPVVMTFTGDICFHDPFANMGAYRQRGSDITKCIDETLLFEMRNADICMINNEFPYSDRGTPLAGKTYTFRSKPENVKILTQMGVDIAGIANNHAFDHGEEAFLDTLDILKKEGILYAGGGRNLTEAASPVILEKGGMKIGFVAATQIERSYPVDTRGATDSQAGVMRSFSEEEYNRFLEAIRSAKQQCDFLVVFIHWGSENTAVLDAYQTGQAAGYAEAGADLVVGGHPHCLQGIGKCGNVPVIYSLGNYWFNSKTVDTALLKVTVQDGDLKSVQMIPALQHDCRTDHVEGADKQRIIDYINSISRDGVSLDSEGYLSW